MQQLRTNFGTNFGDSLPWYELPKRYCGQPTEPITDLLRISPIPDNTLRNLRGSRRANLPPHSSRQAFLLAASRWGSSFRKKRLFFAFASRGANSALNRKTAATNRNENESATNRSMHPQPERSYQACCLAWLPAAPPALFAETRIFCPIRQSRSPDRCTVRA